MQVVATELEGPIELSGIVTREDDDGGILRRARGKNKVAVEVSGEEEEGEDEGNDDKLEEDGVEVDLDMSEEE